ARSEPKASTSSKPIVGNKKDENLPLNKIDVELINLLVDSVSDLGDEDGWTFLGELGNFVMRKKPDFDPRNYGYPKLLALIKDINKFEIDAREAGNKNVRHIYIRVK